MGPEEGEKQEWVEKEKARIRAGRPDAEVVTMFAFEADAGELEEALSGASLFSSYTFVVLKHYELLRKDSPVNKVIARFAKEGDPGSASLAVLSSDTAYSLPAAITKAVPKENIVTFWEMFEDRKQDWIRSFFRKEGRQIAPDAVRLILDLVDNNTLEMKEACNRLAVFLAVTGKAAGPVTSDDVSAYLAHTKAEDGFSLFSHMAKRNLSASLSSLRKILTSDPRGSIGVMAVLTRQYRLLESFLALKQKSGEETAFKEACALSSSGAEVKGIRALRDKETFRAAARKMGPDDAGRIVAYLERMDASVKTTAAEDTLSAMELLVYTIVVNNGRETPLKLQGELLQHPLGDGQRY